MKKLFFVLMLSLVAVMPIFASSAPVTQHSAWSLLLGPLGMVAVGMVLSPANIAGLYTTWRQFRSMKKLQWSFHRPERRTATLGSVHGPR